MISPQLIEQLVTERIADTEIFLVETRVSPDNRVVVYLDSSQGVSIDECVLVSRHIENSIDREVEDYELEVSSAGLSSALKVPRQYLKHQGKKVAVVTMQGEKLEGIISESDQQGFSLLTTAIGAKGTPKKTPVATGETRRFAYSDVKTVKLIIIF